MDQAKVLNFKKSLSESNNILIILPEYIDTDTISAATSIYSFITHSLKKKAFLGSSSEIPQRFDNIISTLAIDEDNIMREIKPLQYIVKVENTEKDLEIIVDRKDSEVSIVMIPKITEIDLNKVTLSTSGNKFDMFIFVNCKELADAGNFHSQNTELFKKSKPYSINANYETADSFSLHSNENTTASETIYEVLDMFGLTFNQAIKDVLFEGIVSGTDGLHRVNSSNAIETILKLVSAKDLPAKMNSIFYGYSSAGLELRKKIFANVKQSGNIVYSELTNEDLTELGIKGNQLDGIDYLPFGIVEEKNTYYILAYEDADHKNILIQYNNSQEVFNKLKQIGYSVSRSNNIVCVKTKNNLPSIIEILTGERVEETAAEEPTTDEVEDVEESSSQKYENVNAEKEQELFENPKTPAHPSPFTPAGENTKSSDTPFQQAK